MRNQGQVILAVIIIGVGTFLLIGNLLDVDVWVFCWPTALILLGLWLLVRPQLVSPDTTVEQKLLGDIRRRGTWQVTDQEFWLGVGDVNLDLTEAQIPLGQTHLRVWQFVGSLKMRVPEDVGVSLSATAFVVDVRFFERKRDSFFVPLHMTSDNYELAERKIHLETTAFVADVRIRR